MEEKKQHKISAIIARVNVCLTIVLWIMLAVLFIAILSFWNTYGKHKYDNVYYVTSVSELDLGKNIEISANEDGTYTARLFGVLPVGTLEIREADRPVLGVGGAGLVILATEDSVYIKAFTSENTKAEALGLQIGDIIHSFNDVVLSGSDWAIGEYVNHFGVNKFTILRDGQLMDYYIELNGEDDVFGISYGPGNYVVGTVSFTDGKNFWGIGHSSEIRLNGTTGVLCSFSIDEDDGVVLNGSLDNSFTVVGDTEYGILGTSDTAIEPNEYMELAWAWEIDNSEGYAQVACSEPGSEGWAYKDVPVKVSPYYGTLYYTDDSEAVDYNFVIESEDFEFMRGMSGSPVIQNGRLIGIIAAVDVNNPTRAFILTAEDAYMKYLAIKE